MGSGLHRSTLELKVALCWSEKRTPNFQQKSSDTLMTNIQKKAQVCTNKNKRGTTTLLSMLKQV